MSQSWPLIPLGELLAPVSRPELVKAEATYSILGAHWYAAGLYTKEITTGAGIQATSLYRVEEGDFVYNRLFAWKGSFAVATKENAGCYVSRTSSLVSGRTLTALTLDSCGDTSAAVRLGMRHSPKVPVERQQAETV